MMVQAMVTRSQRRLERKQVVLIAVLILAVAGVSFSLGVLFGKNINSSLDSSAGTEKPKLPVVASVVVPPPPVSEAVPEIMTFYDNLPRGNQAPLGSGINLPQEQEKVATEIKKEAVVKPPRLPPEPLPKAVKVTPAATAGAFVVQVASFRTSDDAGKLASRLKDYKLSTFVESVDLGEKGVWHRVLVGPYNNREDADRTSGWLLEKERLSALVRQR